MSKIVSVELGTPLDLYFLRQLKVKWPRILHMFKKEGHCVQIWTYLSSSIYFFIFSV